MSKRLPLIGLLAPFVLLTPAAQAHHSFSAEFDLQKPVHIEGTMKEMEWVNPHSWLHVMVKQPDGKEVEWKVEGGAPSALLRRGWNRNSLPPGTKVIVDGFAARDGSFRMNARDIVFPDGRKLNLASSNTDEKGVDSAKPAGTAKPADKK